jgi:hypothetical protein
MTYIDTEGRTFQGETDGEVVEAIRSSTFFPEEDTATWMREVSRRIYDYLHETIDCTSDALFLQTLVQAGLLQRVKVQ